MSRTDPLHRRSIRAALMKQHGWRVESRVDGWVDVQVPSGRVAQDFAREVREAVEYLGYAPFLTLTPDNRTVRVRTPETLQQAGRGEHGTGARPVRSEGRHVPPDPPTPTDRREDPSASIPSVIESQAEIGDAAPDDWVRAIRPARAPYLHRLSSHSSLTTWHVDVPFGEYAISPAQADRWKNARIDAAETWRKRPLVTGTDSGCIYSCGEVELAARFRAAGYEAFWISEWSAFPHWPAWEPFCVKRSELRDRLPQVWEHDHALRARFPELALGTGGGHPDVVAWQPGTQDLYFVEYKGPGDSINPKQNAWASAFQKLGGTSRYVVALGRITPSTTDLRSSKEMA